VELEQTLLTNCGVHVPGTDPTAAVLQRLRALENQVCTELRTIEARLRPVLDDAVSKLGKKENRMFEDAHEKPGASA
jgi:hypothetical protein